MQPLAADQRPVNDLIEEFVLGRLKLDEGFEDPQHSNSSKVHSYGHSVTLIESSGESRRPEGSASR
jgi:hypothetical protein